MNFRILTLVTLAFFTAAVLLEVLAFSRGLIDAAQAMLWLGLGCIVACLPLLLQLRSERSRP
jgi:hypothetical protein